MNSPLVTISIPIYQCELHIERCLQSVVNQSYQNLEILLVDDKGTDSSMERVVEMMNQYPLRNWKLIANEKNSGLSVVRNVGINEAQGKYLFFLDSDDELMPDAIAKLVKAAEREQVEMVCGNTITIQLDSKQEVDAFKLKQFGKLMGNQPIFESFVHGLFPVPSWNKLMKVEVLRSQQAYFKEGLFAQDNLQTFIMVLSLNSAYFLEDDTYIYYLHAQSVIHNRNKKHFENWNTILEEMDGYYHKEKNAQRKLMLRTFFVNFKDQMLIINWKAKKSKELWLYSYSFFKKTTSLSLSDYLSPKISLDLKKKNFLQNLPNPLGYFIFRKRFGN